jgi:hypothetical protein
MAKISTYPIVSVPDFSDLLIGTDVENLNETKNFTIGDIADLIIVGSYVPYTGAIANVDLGIHSITASSFIVPGGLASQFVKADGSLDSTVYQPAGNYMTGLSGEATASGPGVSAVVLSNGAVIGKVLTGLTVTGGSISSSDSILQAFGKLQNQVNSLYGGAIYQGTWNALTNNPLIQSGVGTKGYYYVVNVAGSTNIDGITDWNVGDWIIFDGTAWQQVDNTDTVVSVNGQVGVVVLTTTDIAEGTNLYYTDVRARGALLLTTVGSSGASTYNSLTGTFNIPNYTLSGLGGVPSSRLLTINGTQYDLSADRSWSVGTVTSVGTSGPLTGGTITGSGTIGITQSGVSTDGYLSSTDWNTFNNKQNALTNPVTGTGTVYYLPMWSGLTTLTDSIISYTANVINYNYNSASGATVNYININGTPYTYTIQMNNVGTRQTYHSYTDGNIIQRIGVNDVSRNLSTGQLVLPSYTTLTSFTGTTVGYIGFDASGNIITVPIPTAGITGSGAAGQVAYWNGTSSQTGSNNLFWDAANARLGIGTNAPSVDLHLKKAGTVTSTIETTTATGRTITQIASSISNYLDWRSHGASFTSETWFGQNSASLLTCSSNGGKFVIGTYDSRDFILGTANTERARITSAGNFIINNSATDGGQRLQVMGDAFIKGSGNTNATIGLLIQDSSSTQLFRLSNDGTIILKNWTGGFGAAITGNATTNLSIQQTIGLAGTHTATQFFCSFSNTSGTSSHLLLDGSFNPSSGSGGHAVINIARQINQTGTASGVSIGLYVNPTLTAAADWRSIQWQNNSGWGLYGAGTANNLLNGATTINNIVTIDTTTQYALRLANTSKVIAGHTGAGGSEINLNLAAVISGYSSLNIRTILGTDITLQTGAVTKMQVFGATGNVVIQNGGTFTDAGFRLDVNGTARVSGQITAPSGVFWGAAPAECYLASGGGGTSAIILFRRNIYISNGGDNILTIDAGNGGGTIAKIFTSGTQPLCINGNGRETLFGLDTATASPSALVRMESTTKGFLPPRMTTVQRDAIASPATGLSVYNTTTNTSDYYNGTAWSSLASGNIYTVDGTLTADRTVTSNGNSLTILGGKETFAGEQRALWLKTSTNAKSSVQILLENTFTTTGKTYEIGSDSSGAFNISDRTASAVRLKIDNLYFQFHSNASSNANLLGQVAGINALWFNQGALTATTANYTLCNASGITLLNAPTGGEIRFRVGNAEKMMLTNAGRLLLGTTTESTFLLDVNGTARVSGAMTLNNGLTITAAGANITGALNASTAASNHQIGNFQIINSGSASSSGLGFSSENASMQFQGYTAATLSTYPAYFGFRHYNNATTTLNFASAGIIRVYNIGWVDGNVANVSGNSLWLQPIYNFTGTQSGIIVRGFYYDPVLTSITNTTHRAIETRSGDVLLGTTSGSVGVGVNTSINASAIIDITSTTKGFLPPRMTTTQKNAISSPAAGLQVYDTILNKSSYYNGTAWVDGGDNIYNANGTLTSNRTVSSGGYSLIFNPQTTYITTLTASTGGSSYSVLGSNTLSFASGFSSSNIGNVYSANGAINLQTFAGSADFAQANLASAMISVNSIDFSAAGATITMTQASGIRAMTGHQSQIQYQGTNSGTITHAAVSQNLGFYRPSAATGILTITNAYSLLINDLNDYGTGFTLTNRWGIYQNGASDNNYFKGKVIIGSTDTVGVSPLNVKNLPTSSAGLATGDIWNNGGVLNIA